MDHKQNTTNSERSVIAKRHITNEPATVEVYGRTGKIYCRMNNLSTTGAFFEIVSSTFTPKKGDFVQVTISLKQLNKSHTLHGQVVWNKGLGVGVSFLKGKDILKKITR